MLYGRTLLRPILRSLPTRMGRIGVAVKFPLSRAPMCDFLVTLLRLRARKFGFGDNHCAFRSIIALLGRPCAQRLANRTRLLRGRLAQGGHFCPLPNRLNGSRFLAQLFAPLSKGLGLYVHLSRALRRITNVCRTGASNARSASTFGRLCQRSLFGTCAAVGQFHALVRRSRLAMRDRAFQQLLIGILSTAGVPFRNRPTVNVRIVKMLRAHGLSFHRLMLLSIGRKRLPGSKKSSSFVPCGLHGTFKVAAVRRGVTMCTCCFCHLLRQTREVALVCGADSSKLGHNR